jgi:hypothetical protein
LSLPLRRLYQVHPWTRTPIHNWNLGAAQIHQAIVDPHPGKCGHEVLYGAHLSPVFSQSRSMVSILHVFWDGFDQSGRANIGATENDSMTYGCWLQCKGNIQARM